MSGAERFFDTSVLLYLLSGENQRAGRVEGLLERSGVISVQVLNEFAAVATRKLRMSLIEVREVLDIVRTLCRTDPITVECHDRALEIMERYGFSLYDSLIVASALLADCKVLYSEDLQDGQVIGGKLAVLNPFMSSE
jgi:predicted nucleic acid-binding protein